MQLAKLCLIHDMWRNGTNSKVTFQERLVLPRVKASWEALWSCSRKTTTTALSFSLWISGTRSSSCVVASRDLSWLGPVWAVIQNGLVRSGIKTAGVVDFGQSVLATLICAHPFLDLMCVMGHEGGGPNLEKSGPRRMGPGGWGPEGWGGTKFRVFFPSPAMCTFGPLLPGPPSPGPPKFSHFFSFSWIFGGV